MRVTAAARLPVLVLCLVVGGCANAPAVQSPQAGTAGAPPGTAGAPLPTGSATAAPGGSGASGSPSQLDFGSDYFTAPPNPLNLTITSDRTRSATAHITTAGGSLTATGADGTTFALEIPKDALSEDTDVTMTPITDIQGWGVAPGNAAAVAMEPEGLKLATPGRLVITPAQPIGDVQGAPFGFYGDGKDAGLLLSDAGATGIVIPIEHFSGGGFFWNVSIPFWLAWARYKQTQAEDRLKSRLAAELGLRGAIEKAGGVPDKSVNDIIEGIVSEWERDILNRRLLLASKSCADAQFAVNGFSYFNHAMAIMRIDRTIDPPPRLLNLARYVCAEEATRLCFANGDVERLRSILLIDSQSLAVQGKSTGGDTSAYFEACDRFELQVKEHSAQLLTGPQGSEGYKADLTITIPIRFVANTGDSTALLGDTEGDGNGVFTAGSGTLLTAGAECTYKLKGDPADVPFNALLDRVEFINTGPERTTQRLKDIKLQFKGGHLTAEVTVTCSGQSGPYGTKNLPFGFARYKGANEGAVSISGWVPDTYPVLATKTFTRAVDLGSAGQDSEKLELKLVHTPGPMPPRPDIPAP